MPLKMKKSKKTVKLAKPKKRSQSAPPAGESIGSIRSMMQKMDAKLSAYPKGGFANKGEQMGAKFGTLGRLAGRGLGAGLSAITGYGNYTVKRNSLGKVSSSCDMVPQFVKNEHSIRVVHREYISDVVVPANPTQFQVTYAQKINPGNTLMFPWLAKMAKQYSQYKIHGMVFTFKTMSSEYSANGPLGTVMMATNYDAIERIYASKVELENSEFAVSCKPSESLIHAIECDPKYSTLEMLYIRDSSYENAGETADRRFFDFGTFQFATSGLPGLVGSTMGEFWVSYDIELCKPVVGGSTDIFLIPANTIVSNPSGLLAVSNITRPLNIQWTGTAYSPAGGEVVNLSPNGSNILTYSGDVAAIDKAYALNGNNLEFYLPGKYIVTYSLWGTATTARVYLSDGKTTTNVPALTAFGTAIATVTTPFSVGLGTGELGFVPNYPREITSTNLKVSFQATMTVIVTGIPYTGLPIGTNYIKVVTPTYVAAPTTSSNIQNLFRRIDVEYVCFGANTQTVPFT